MLRFAFLLALCLAFPAQGQVSVLSALSNDQYVAPGAVYTGTVLVRNDTDAVQEVAISASDYHFESDGSNRFDDPGSQARSNAEWITYSPARLTLPPRATLPVQYEVRVPQQTSEEQTSEEQTSGEQTDAEAVLCGSYWSLLFVQASAMPRPKRPAPRPYATVPARVWACSSRPTSAATAPTRSP